MSIYVIRSDRDGVWYAIPEFREPLWDEYLQSEECSQGEIPPWATPLDLEYLRVYSHQIWKVPVGAAEAACLRDPLGFADRVLRERDEALDEAHALREKE